MGVWRNWQHAIDLKSIEGNLISVRVRVPPPLNIMNKSIITRIKENIELGGADHWLWKGTLNNKYPYIKYKGKATSVTRLVLTLWKGEIFGPNDQANHIPSCNIKRCVNPNHLYKGTHLENMRDERIVNPPKTKKQKNAEYYARHNQHRKNFGRLNIE
jgi:hypothetical protein